MPNKVPLPEVPAGPGSSQAEGRARGRDFARLGRAKPKAHTPFQAAFDEDERGLWIDTSSLSKQDRSVCH